MSTKKETNAEAGTVTWTFDDGTQTVFELAKCSADIQKRLALHGASQKGGDSYAGAGQESDPLAYAKAAVADVITQLYNGDWRATSAGPRGPSDLALAVSRALGNTVEEAVAMLDELDDDGKKALRGKPKVKAQLAAIKAQKAVAAAEKAAKAAEAAEAA